MSRGRGLWFPVAEPSPGREATNEVYVSERGAGSQLQMSLFVQGQPGPAWVDPSAPLALASPHPARRPPSHPAEPAALLLAFTAGLFVVGLGCFLISR